MIGKPGLGGLAFLMITIGAIASFLYSGNAYTTGKIWFEGCYEYKLVHKGFEEPIAENAFQAAFWKTCESISRRGIFSQGLIFSGPKSEKELRDACPSFWEDLPIGGSYLLSLSLVEQAGGVSVLNYFLPAERMIGTVYSARWPNCASAATKLGYPKLEESKTVPGTFEWSRPCEPCTEK